MPVRAYYNEHEKFAAQWLRNLIEAGHIAPGDVDERSIVDVKPSDLEGYTQAHFFAGIGGWSLALRMAGWSDSRPVWSGSCPCQPFSVAGKGKGTQDERHLWPTWNGLIRVCRPPVVFGEQVSDSAGFSWLDAVRADLEDSGYAVAALDIPACSVGAPHIRQRLWWVGDSLHSGPEGTERAERDRGLRGEVREAGGPGPADDGLADSDARGLQELGEQEHRGIESPRGGLSHGHGYDREQPWANHGLVDCSDGRARPVPALESTVLGMVDGLPVELVCQRTPPLSVSSPGRVGKLRGYGNAISPPLAAQFIAVYMECRP